MSDKKQYVKWGPKGSALCVDKVEDFIDHLKSVDEHSIDEYGCLNLEETFEFKIIQMTDEEFQALPEFEGF